MADTLACHRDNDASIGRLRRGLVFGVAERTDRAVAHGRAVGIGGMVLRTRLQIRSVDMLDAGLVDMRSCMMLAGDDGQEDERNRHHNEQPNPRGRAGSHAPRQFMSNVGRGSGQLGFTFAALGRI